jgi:glycerol uptake facilitator-like aquaporin
MSHLISPFFGEFLGTLILILLGDGVVAGVLLGIVYHVLNKVSLHLGLLNDWTAFSSAVMPTFLFLLTGILMLMWVETQ